MTATLLATGTVRHLRLRPASHHFDYRTYFLLLPLRRLPLAPEPGKPGSIAHRTALVMPIYNEDPLRTTMASPRRR